MTSSSTCDVAAIACAAAIALSASGARAQEQKERDPVAAEALFKAGRQLVDKGDYAAGCPKFEASLALNPSASTMINIALCHEHDGKLATAWEDYHRALVLNRETAGEQRRKGLEEIANKGIAALEPRLPRLRVAVANAPADLVVQRDGKNLPAAALGEALPADPGPHEIRASAPGFAEETRSVTLEEGKTAEVSITLRAAAPADEKAGSSVPTWAWIAGGAGIVFTGAAIGFLVDNRAAVGALRDNCREVQGGTFCNPGYDFAADNARKNRDLGLFIGLGTVGVVGIGAAVVGIVRAGSVKEPAKTAMALPWVGPDAAGATVVGSF